MTEEQLIDFIKENIRLDIEYYRTYDGCGGNMINKREISLVLCDEVISTVTLD